MKMAKQQKPAFLFYASNMDVISAYPEEVQRKIIMWIFQYGFEGEVSGCPDDLRDVLSPIFYGIDVQRRRYTNVNKLNEYIDSIKFRALGTTDKNKVAMLDDAISLLRREIVRCQKSDILTEDITSRISAILSNPLIKNCLHHYGQGDNK